MSWKRSLPSGTNDRLFKEAFQAQTLERTIQELFQQRGYQRIETPTIEFEEVFADEEAYLQGVYRFFDRSGRVVVLRPDMTLPIGRVLASTGVQLPVQLYYSGKVFRANDAMSGQQNEQLQAGLEFVGYPALKAEVEALVAAQEVVQQVAIRDVHFELGHAKIYTTIVAELDLDESAERTLRTHLLNKSTSGLAQFIRDFPSPLDDFILAWPRLFGEVEATLEKARNLTQLPALEAAFAEVLTLTAYLKGSLNSPLTIDLGFLPTLSYYTGIIFRGFADQSPDFFLSGGRYDSLLSNFGAAAQPAVGLAFNLEELMHIQQAQFESEPERQAKVLIFYEADALAEALAVQATTGGSQLSLFETWEETQSYAQKWEFAASIYVSKTDATAYPIVKGEQL